MNTVTLGRLLQALAFLALVGIAADAAGASLRVAGLALAAGALLIGSVYAELVGPEDRRR